MVDTANATPPAAAPAASAPAADVSDADLDRLAGEAFDKAMSDAPAGEAPADAIATPAEEAASAPRADGRDDKGRFAPKAGEEKPAEGEDQAKAEPTKDGEKPAGDEIPLAPPTSWRALGDEWANLPRTAQQKILAREREINAGFSDMGRKVKSTEPIVQVLGHHRDFLAQTGMEAPHLIHGLIQQYQALNASPRETLSALAREYRVDPLELAVGNNPAAAIQRIAQQHRIDLLDLVANGSEQQVAPGRPDPVIAQLEARIAAQDAELRRITGHLTGQERAARDYTERQVQARESQVMDTITPVIEATPDWDALAPRVASLLPLVQADNPGASPDAILKAAIDEARWSDPKVRSRLTAEKATAISQAKITSMTDAAGKAKAATAANVKGAAGNTSPAPLTADAEYDAVWKKLGFAS